MKRIFFLIIMLMSLLPKNVFADDYKILWKQVETAKEKDLPKTQINIIDKIITKATKEKNYGNLLKAELYRLEAVNEISHDSTIVAIEKLTKKEQNIKENTPLAAVYQLFLGKIYEYNLSSNENADSISEKYYAKAMSNTAMLAKEKIDNYTPFFDKEKDSKYFNYDLLHVFGYETKNFLPLYNYYKTTDMREAACLSGVRYLEKAIEGEGIYSKETKEYKEILQLINTYQDLDVCGEAAILQYKYLTNIQETTNKERIDFIDYATKKWANWSRICVLTNQKTGLTIPQCNVMLNSHIINPQENIIAKLTSVRNIKQASLIVTRINLNVGTIENYEENYDFEYYSKLKEGKPTLKKDITFKNIPPYEFQEDSINIGKLPLGIYLLEIDDKEGKCDKDFKVFYVTELCFIRQPLPNKNEKYIVVNSLSGEPIKNAKIKLFKRKKWNEKENISKEIITDKDGVANNNLSEFKVNYVWVHTDNDTFLPISEPYSMYHREIEPLDKKVAYIYTDRSIYRPGQTVNVAYVGFNRYKNNETKPLKNENIEITFGDANGQKIETKKLTTDEYGTAHTSFTIPSSGLNGKYIFSATNGSYQYISVEEYKRPTFDLEVEKPNTAYAIGDTVVVKLKAKSLAGVPVKGAKVEYNVSRNSQAWWYFRRYNNDKSIVLLKEQSITDDNGECEIKMPMILPEKDKAELKDEWNYIIYSIIADIKVTDIAGESHSIDCSLPLSLKNTFLSSTITQQMRSDEQKNIRFNYTNNSGKEVEGVVKWKIKELEKLVSTSANKDFDLEKELNIKLKSGKYTLEAECNGDSLTQTFVVFSLNDNKPCYETNDWFYVSDTQFKSNNEPVTIQVGASNKDMYVYCTKIYNNNLQSFTVKCLNNELINEKLTYKEEYGNGVLLVYSWVKNGKVYSHSTYIAKPQPDKRLILKWKTFRDKLTAGQKEEWVLSVTKPDGTAAKAQILTTMFDFALQDIVAHKWNFDLSLFNINASITQGTTNFEKLWLSLNGNVKYLNEPDILISGLYNNFSFTNRYRFYESLGGVGYAAPRLMKSQTNSVDTKRAVAVKEDAMFEEDAVADSVMEENDEGNDEGNKQRKSVRQNLNETAFFYPSLLSDNEGNVSIKFTLPESLTTWRIMALAHDEDMNYGTIENNIIASKDLMVQPNMPRFLRIGDNANISAKITNTTEKTLKGTAKIELLLPETEKVLYENTQEFIVDGNGNTSVSFNFKPINNVDLYVCRITANTETFSDGEQNYLPILPDYEQVTTTYPITLHKAEKKIIDLTKMFDAQSINKRLTIEYTNNASWLILQALPTITAAENDNAIDLSTIYFANALGENIIKISPDIQATIKKWQQEGEDGTSLQSALQRNEELKNIILNETPWVVEAKNETTQKRNLAKFFDKPTMDMRINSSISKLEMLQNSDGSFSWWQGMRGSVYVTQSVITTLLRTNKLIGTNDLRTKNIITKGISYLSTQLKHIYQEDLKREKKGSKIIPSENTCNIMYILTIDESKNSVQTQKIIDYYINKTINNTKILTVFGKARMATIFAKNGKIKEANLYINSIKELSVYTEEAGRYFDSYRATNSWCDYKIPSVVACIETFSDLKGEEEKNTIEEMQRWLLHEKRTQAWDTPINSTEAIYAFLNNNTSSLNSGDNATLYINDKEVEGLKPTAGMGYVKAQITEENPKTFTINKTNNTTSWGAIYAQSQQKVTNILQSNSGMIVKREILSDKTTYNVGDKIKIRITVKADRDYDFVAITDKRAACLEPINQTSGYQYGCYVSPKDNATTYYFDILPKGTWKIETEYYIDKSGTYTSGTCSAQCMYSPEFISTSGAIEIKITE